MDGKCHQFQNYLHSSGMMKALKEALASLFRLESWPANPIDFVCHNLLSEQNETVASLTNELEELRNKVQYLRNIVPEEEFREKKIHDEKRKNIEEVNKISEEHESEIVLIQPVNDINQDSKESDQETILMIEELDRKVSQEDEKSDQIPKRESEKLSEINGSNSLKNESEIRVKQPISNRWNKNRKNRKNRRE